LLEEQGSKSYSGVRATRPCPLLRPFVMGEAHAADPRIVGLQTPGGCGALFSPLS
jgi:aromatic-amino-acid transaminase